MGFLDGKHLNLAFIKESWVLSTVSSISSTPLGGQNNNCSRLGDAFCITATPIISFFAHVQQSLASVITTLNTLAIRYSY